MKKERYFTLENLKPKSRRMLRDVSSLRERHNLRFKPERSALLVLDMQRYFLDTSSHAFIPAAHAILPGLRKLIDSYRRSRLPVIFTRHMNSKSNAGMMSRWWKDLPQEGPLSEIIPALNDKRDPVIQKSQYDAFYHTRLEEMLRRRGVEQVVISGVMANLCCETTARGAFIRRFAVFFVIDGTAAYNEAFHRATILNAAHGFAVPVLVNELLAVLRSYDAD